MPKAAGKFTDVNSAMPAGFMDISSWYPAKPVPAWSSRTSIVPEEPEPVIARSVVDNVAP
ncbi:hypothetical protein [Methanospirillum sp.]|uniref:hypothetical protein n=1 Tax=Methanospirillum sp. TaxID=45200 RepID=UPI0034421157